MVISKKLEFKRSEKIKFTKKEKVNFLFVGKQRVEIAYADKEL